MLSTHPYRVYPCGDHAVTIELGNAINETINQKVLALYQYLLANPVKGVRDIIPAYHTLTLVYDLALLKRQDPAASVYENMNRLLQNAADAVTITTMPARRIKIPVCYDVSVAPDIVSLADSHEISIEEVISLHTNRTYRVYMIGFLPGFAYMGSVDEKIITPRKSKPRTIVPSGSVGIAGKQTGIYPLDSPGGWQLIGQTPVQLFDAKKVSPCYLQPGDEVSFYSIPLTEFENCKQP